jgi:hypothetical protein
VQAYTLGNPWRRLVLPKEIEQPSLKFNSKIGSVAWIDDLELELTTKGPSMRAQAGI